MKIQVITDSTSDIPQDMAEKIGIRVVPIYIRFGDKIYRDGVDMEPGAFYTRLLESPFHPATSQPTPEDFESVYRDYCDSVDGIISIHISSKISGTFNSANIAKKNVGSRCPIEVIDSRLNSAGLALAAMNAAAMAKKGENLSDLADKIRAGMSRIDMFGFFDTMKYLARSGRVSRTIVAAASILNVKPLLTFRDGDIVRAGLVRSVSRGMDRLYKFVQEKRNIAEMIIVHSIIPSQAETLKKRLGGFYPEDKINIMEMGAGLGVHGGPGVLLVGLREG